MAEFRIKKPLFGNEVEIVLQDAEGEIARDVAESAYAEGSRLNRIFNFYDKNSELSKLNSKRKLRASPELVQVIKLAKELSRVTPGYDVSLGKNFRNIKEHKPELKLSCSHKDISLNGNQIILKHPDVEVDLGSIAKGYIVDKLAANLRAQGVISGFVNGRGDIVVFGEKRQVNIQHPRDNSIVKSIILENQAVATSGDYNQYHGSFDKCHILNRKSWISVTVVAPNLVTADALATAIFVSGNGDIKKLLRKSPQVRAMTITGDLKINYYNRFQELLA